MSEEEYGEEEKDGDLIEKLDENLPARARCYMCSKNWKIIRPTPLYCETDIRCAVTDCPTCGCTMLVHFTHMRDSDVCQVVPTRGDAWYTFWRPFQNFWRRHTGFYNREGSIILD